MAAPIDFYFEFASPYGYLASCRIDDLAAAHGRTVRWHPVMLGAMMKETGSRPLVEVPLKADYFLRDITRFAAYLGVPLHYPALRPVMNSLAASRAFYWLDDQDPALARQFAELVFYRHWAEGEDLGPPEAVATLAAELGIDGPALLAAMADPLVKTRLKEAGEAAMARGVFGSPFFIVDGEKFWGADRLDQLEAWLTGRLTD